MSVSLFPGHGFPTQLTLIYVRLGVFAASNSDIVQLRSIFPLRGPRLLVADTTAIKVGLVLNRWPFCAQSVCLDYLRQPYCIPQDYS